MEARRGRKLQKAGMAEGEAHTPDCTKARSQTSEGNNRGQGRQVAEAGWGAPRQSLKSRLLAASSSSPRWEPGAGHNQEVARVCCSARVPRTWDWLLRASQTSYLPRQLAGEGRQVLIPPR